MKMKVVAIGSVLFLVTALVLAVQTYFNTKEINALTEDCIETGSGFKVTITNEFTSDYEFECKD